MAKDTCSGAGRIKKALAEIRATACNIRNNAMHANYTSPSEADVLDRAADRIEKEI